MINIPKGTKDVLPQESFKWQQIEQTAREVAKVFATKEIRTPTFEMTEVFSRGIGDTTDVVNKEMYTFLDKGNRSITLKPEGTAGVARSFVSNNLANMPQPLKLFYITPCFRYERPQAGRLREFHQIGFELLGSYSSSIDVEAILIADTFFKKLNIQGLELNINSIGCKHCRAKYNHALKEFLAPHLENMCSTCKDRFEKNPLRILDCKEEKCQHICKVAPRMLDYLCEDCKEHFEQVQKLLKIANVNFNIDSSIVRGLDYYNKTVFEFVSKNIGAQGTVCGGGRYEGLIEEMGGSPTCGVGFALGIERLLLLMEQTNTPFKEEERIALYIATMGEEEYLLAFELATALRISGVNVEIDHMNKSVKAQFKYANKINAKYIITIGSSELESGVFTLKNMDDKQVKEMTIEEIKEFFIK